MSEPNDELLRLKAKGRAGVIMQVVFWYEALLGRRPEKGCFVMCDRDTMARNDINNGNGICEVGFAPLCPAEFMIFRIQQKTAQA